ncbi:collagen-like triple helix repeat-containing protein [Tautonia rosea]|uniref:collagen-like triple helix repeat-containing protein n=1 Tax=Tautonia rosea TaxID=2728037 RepID=UPI0014766ED4|nr:collagen-like protein [Tautonia rosea]
MRVDPSRASALALWFVAMLAIAGSPHGAHAQAPPNRGGGFERGAPPAAGAGGPAGGQAAGQGGAVGGYGPPGGYGQPGQSGPASESAAPASRQAPVDLDAVPIDTTPLARFIPEDAYGAFLEFNGLNAAPNVWQGSSAYAMLNDTSLGEMLQEVIAQFIEAAPNAPAGVMTGPEVVAVLEHLARHGMVLASPMNAQGSASEAILVLRGAAHREVRPLFGKLIGTIAAEGAKPQVVSKPGNRQIVVMDTPPFGLEGVTEWAWWIEGDDLVFVFNSIEAADRVMAVLDEQAPNAVNNPIRQQLMAVENGFQPLAVGSLQLDRPGAGEAERSMIEENGLNRLDLRWGFDGEDSLTVVNLDAPAPRQGFMTAFDQPAIPMSDLPPIPREVDNLTILSVNPAGIYDALSAIADQSAPPLATQLQSFEESVRSRARLDFRDDVLASLGPKITAYTLPRPVSRPASGNPLAGIMNALGGLGLPQFVVAIELQNGSEFTSKLDGMILAINEQLASLLPPPPEPPPADGAGAFPPAGAQQGRQGGGLPGQAGRDEAPEPPEPPKFSMTLATPRTYLLRLPEGLYGLTGYQPTITMGQNYLIFASNPVAARQCRELEQADADDRWSPPANLAGRLPGNLTMLVVNDPSQSLPSAIAGLPAALNAAMASAASALEPGAAGGGPAGGAPGAMASGPGASGFSPTPNEFSDGDPRSFAGGAAGSAPPPGASGFQGQPGAEGYPGAAGASGYPGAASAEGYPGAAGASGYPGAAGAGGYPGAPGVAGAPGAPAGPTTIRISPTLIPSPDSLRRYLGTAVYSVSADEGGIRIEARESVPGQWGLDGLGAGPALSLPASSALGGRN